MKVAELEIQFGEMEGYSAESRAGELLMSAGIEEELHEGPKTHSVCVRLSEHG